MSPEIKATLFFFLFLFIGSLIGIGMDNINAPAGEVTIGSSEITGVGLEDVPEMSANPLTLAASVFNFLVKLGKGIIAAIIAPFTGYKFLGNPLQPGGGSLIRVFLWIFALLAIWIVLDYIRRFIRG